MATTQDNRLLKIATPLGKDYLLLNSFTGREGLSELFTIYAELVHEESEAGFSPTVIDPKSLLGKGVTITVESNEGTVRDFSGMVNHFTEGNRDVRFTYYNISIVPHVWVLTQNIQSQIFQQISVPDILKKIFQGFDVKWELQGLFEARNYCVQYRESDFAFASRLMEEEGIYYFFEHKEGKDMMIFGNTPQSHRDCPSKHEIPFFVKVGEQDDFVGSINSFLSGHNLQTGKVTLWDFNFQLPTKKLENSETSRFSLGDNQAYELYDYPGGYARKYDGIDKSGGTADSDLQKVFPDRENTVKNWMEALDAQVEVATGRSDVCSFTAGYRFQMRDHPNSDLNKLYTLTSVEHRGAQSPGYVTEVVREPYTNSFQCIVQGAGKPGFRPMRSTPKPIVQGGQTAMVVGPGGEEIYTDKYGRVKVQFPWDRDGQYDANSSCWVRVAQTWAGNKWGGVFIPRIGMEVLVHFLEGDPDQPIITGCVYNPQTMPHYELPKYKTLAYIKTRTSPDDGKGYNELRFEDKANKEQVFIRSQKRYDLRVRGSMYETCGGSRHEIIGLKQENQPGGNLAITVAGCYDLHVKEDHFIGIDGKQNETVKADVVENYQGKQYTEVTGKRELNAQEITLEALSKITLKVGGSFVSIDLSGVTVSGPMVKINSGGAGARTGPSDISDPLDAEVSDNGEPGYLERPRSGGGGRKTRTLNGQHAPPFETKTLPNGDIQVGNGLVIKKSPTDPDFQKKALDDLTTMSNYPAGMDTLNSINNSGHTTSIQHKPAGGNNYTPSDVAGALPKGDNFGGTTGTGTGSDGTVGWNPDNAATNAKRPRDVGLHHELSHADHASNGDYDITHNDASQPNNPHKEESNTIDRDNEYRKQRGVHTRKDHTEL